MKSQYRIADLICHIQKDNLQVHFAPQDEQIGRLCLREMLGAQEHVEGFFEYSPDLELFVFMYPNLSAMNEAFGRRLPNENCCSVPIKGPEALITFVTPRGNVRSLKSLLAHEFAHIVFGSLTNNREIGRINQRIPTWLDEGAALCIDSKFRENFPEIESRRRDLIKRGANGWWPRLEELYTYFNRLDGSTEFGHRGMLAYAYSYFCVKKLINRHGREVFVKFLSSLASCDDIASRFSQAYGISIGQFDIEMKGILGLSV